MEDIDELRRALEAANMRAAAAEAVAGQAEARVAEVEDELRRLQAQRQAERGVNPSPPKPKLSDGPLTAYGAQLARYEQIEREMIRRLMGDGPSPFEIMDKYIAFDPGRDAGRGKLRRYGGGPRRVTLHYQAENGSVMLRAETGDYNPEADKAEYVCTKIDRHMRQKDALAAIINFAQELDKVKSLAKPSRVISDLEKAVSRVRNGRADYTVVVE